MAIERGETAGLMLLYESFTPDGAREGVEIEAEPGETFLLRVGEEPAARLPLAALERVMDRYGKPLAEGVPLEGPRVGFSDGSVLHRIRHLARYDVIARDFVVLVGPPGSARETMAVLAVSVSGALVHLARAVARPVPGES